MNKLLLLAMILIAIPAHSDELTDNNKILSLISPDSFSEYEFKNLLASNNTIKVINGCDVNPIYRESAIRIQCSKRGTFTTNKSARNHVRTYDDVTHINYSGQTDYRWKTDEIYCVLAVKEEDDIFELYCSSDY